MKTKWLLAFLFGFASITAAFAQNVSARTNDFEVDFSNPQSQVNTTVPVISWVTPVPESNFSTGNKYSIKVDVTSDVPIRNIIIQIKENDDAAVRGAETIVPKQDEEHDATVEKNLTLMDGDNIIQVIAENTDGTKTYSERTVKVGASALADAANLDRSDYALIFVDDKYDNWPNLVNPVFDGHTIADELTKNYGFKVEIIENGTQTDILKKLREYAEKKYKPLDQIFIFFAGHGQYDDTFGEGYVVTRESQLHDEAKTTYLSHNRLRSIINNIPCDHIFLAMDVCFGGTFDAALASSRGLDDDPYKQQSQSEFITRKLMYKTRKYLTSGGKEYVSDGVPGRHSPFTNALLEALRDRGGKDGILTLPELVTYVERLKPAPRFGEFGDNAPGSDFVFIAR